MILVSENELPTLYQLLKRLLYLSDDKVQFIAAGLPSQLPVDLTLPEGAQIIGSVVSEQNEFQILLDVALSSQQVQAFYRQQLLDAGWKQQENVPVALKGFADLDKCETFTDENPKFYHETLRAKLEIQTHSKSNALTDVCLNLKVVEYTNFSENNDSLSVLVDNLAPLPLLESPPNVQLGRIHSSGGNNEYSSQVQLETELDGMTLINHYDSQFEQSGWSQRDKGQDGALVWSNWTLLDNKGQSWLGLLNITKIGGIANRYLAYAQVLRL